MTPDTRQRDGLLMLRLPLQVASWAACGTTVVSWVDWALPADLSGVVKIAAGRDRNLALKSGATVVAWGINHFGQATLPSGLSELGVNNISSPAFALATITALR